MKHFLKYIAYAVIAVLVLINLVLICAVVITVRSPMLTPVPSLGNTDANLALLKEPKADDEYSFLVIGDSKHGDEVFETLTDKADLVENLQFGIHLGDFVAHSTTGEFAFFIHEFSERPHFPLLMVPGNHDVNPVEDKLGLFEKVMGPRQIWFMYRRDLFVIVDNAVRPLSDAQPWVEQVLAEHAPKARNIFVFLHRPVFDVDKVSDTYIIVRKDPFHLMLRKWKVRYVFAGHYHSYLREEIDGIDYIVTGGGGSELYGHRAFYHAVVANVRDTGVQEMLLTTPFKFGLDDEFAGAVYEIFYERYRSNRILFVLFVLAAQVILIGAILFAWRRRRGEKLLTRLT